MSIYRVDIDETICYYPLEREYDKAEPIPENIEKINKRYDEGHTIIYWSSRGASTNINWWFITKFQLDSWGCKYHDLKLDKPEFDFYVDSEKILNIEEM